jgi:hypothetical protein
MLTTLLPLPSARTRTEPDAAFDALPRLAALRDALRSAPSPKRSRWGEPMVFFFDPARQAALAASRTPTASADPRGTRVEEELPALFGSIEIRRAARGTPGLKDAAANSPIPAARELAALLNVPDDETILVLDPAKRTGVRVLVRGVVDVHQFHILLADAAHAALGCPRPPSRFVAAYSGVDAVVPAGVPMIAEGHFQMFKHTAIQPDGSVPPGFRGSDHWLWGNQPLAVIPKFEGERVVLLGPPAFHISWEVERRFPALAANVRLLQSLSAAAVAENLSRLCGNHVPASVPGARPVAA